MYPDECSGFAWTCKSALKLFHEHLSFPVDRRSKHHGSIISLTGAWIRMFRELKEEFEPQMRNEGIYIPGPDEDDPDL